MCIDVCSDTYQVDETYMANDGSASPTPRTPASLLPQDVIALYRSIAFAPAYEDALCTHLLNAPMLPCSHGAMLLACAAVPSSLARSVKLPKSLCANPTCFSPRTIVTKVHGVPA